MVTPAKLKAPLTATGKPKIVLALKQERLKCAQLEPRIKEMEFELQNDSYIIDYAGMICNPVTH